MKDKAIVKATINNMHSIDNSIAHRRREYQGKPFNKSDACLNPFEQFKTWFDEAHSAEITDANAMSLSTVNNAGQPSLRTVLIKSIEKDSLVFFTNYASQKAQDIEGNTAVACLFYWKELNRQVRIQGHATKISPLASARYFKSRPQDSQISAWVSFQSAVIAGREYLETQVAVVKNKFHNGEIPYPEFWGGYQIDVHKFEFWQGRESRLHDRLSYQKTADHNWEIVRLAP